MIALLKLQHLLNKPRSAQLVLARSALHVYSMRNGELSHTVEALGKLLQANEALLRVSSAKSDKQTRAALGFLVRAVLYAVEQVQRRLTVGCQAERTTEEGQQRAGLDQDALAQWRATLGRQRVDVTSSFDGREACQLLQGLTAISEVFGRYFSSFSRGVPPGEEDLYRDAQLVALQAAALVELAASQIRNGGLEKLTAPELSGAALTLARSGYGTSDGYRARAGGGGGGGGRCACTGELQLRSHPVRLGAAVARPGAGEAPSGRRARTEYGSMAD